MSRHPTTTTTTTTPKKKGTKSAPLTPLQQAEQALKQAEGAGFQTGGTTGGTSVPGVTTKLAGDMLPFTAPHQLPWFNPPSGTLSTTSSGATQVSYSNFVDFIHQIKDNPTLLERVQRALKQSGLLPSTWANYGTLDKATTSAWEQLGQSAIGGTSPVTSLLNSGMSEGNLGTVLKSIQDKANSAQALADSASSVNVNLTDRNEIAQRYASAMESMGMGAPSIAQTKKFVDAFAGAEVSAAQNQSEVQKQNYLAGAGDLTTALHQATFGNVAGALAAERATGPTFVATKAMPNLDAEALASAKAADPGMYFANQTSYLYGMIQDLLSGNQQVPTTPTSPTSMPTVGAIVTAPGPGSGTM
jgi:hypothetical protein